MAITSKQQRQQRRSEALQLLSDGVPPTVSKAAVQRCITKLSPHWDDEQLEAVVSMFKANGLL